MKDFTDVASRALELSETISEGLEYANVQLDEMKYENAFHMLDDILIAVESIEDALTPMLPELPGNQIEIFTFEVKKYLDDARHLYKSNNTMEFQEVIRHNVLQKWQDELRRVLAPLAAS